MAGIKDIPEVLCLGNWDKQEKRNRKESSKKKKKSEFGFGVLNLKPDRTSM